MALILGLAAGAAVIIKVYNSMKASNPEQLQSTLTLVRQGAGVIAALSRACFEILSALQGIRPQTVQQGSPTVTRFGTTAAQLEAARA